MPGSRESGRAAARGLGAGSNTNTERRTLNAELRTEEEEQENERPGVSFLRFGGGSSALDVGCSPFGAWGQNIGKALMVLRVDWGLP